MFDAAKDLCDVLISHQVKDEKSAEFGGIPCALHETAHARAGEAVFPFCFLYCETKEKEYLASALRLMRWLSKTQKEDGSWERGSWETLELGTVSLTLALCHAYQLVAGELGADDRGMLEKTIRAGAEYVYRKATSRWLESFGPGINCLALSCPTLQLAYMVTGDGEYRDRAKGNAALALRQINEEGFLVGEGPTGCGPRLTGVDVGFNLEIGLGALVAYWCLSGDEEVRDAVLKALKTHLNFVTPSGYIDNSWGSRMWQWTLLGSNEGNGCQVAFLPLRNFDARFQRAAGQNLRYMLKNMMKDGLVTEGPHEKENPGCRPPCPLASALRANAVCQAMMYCGGVPLSREGKGVLPTEEKGWVRFYRTVNVVQVRTSGLLCTITGRGAGETEGVDPSGGTLSHLWHEGFGTVQAASAYILGVHDLGDPPLGGWLTPRIEAIVDGELFSNVFEPNAVLSPSGDSLVDDRLEVGVRGRLKSVQGEDPGLAYAVTYRFEGATISKEITVEGSREAKLRSVEPIVFAKGCELTPGEGRIEIRHPSGSSCVLRASSEAGRIQGVSRQQVLWTSSPALYGIPIVIEPAEGGDRRRIAYTMELRG
jgi:hypothetical protein